MSRAYLISLAIVCLAPSGCDDRGSQAQAPTSATPTGAPHEVTITRAEYGDAWPFTVDSGVLAVRPVNNGPLTAVTFTSGGTTYAVNGAAMGTKQYSDIATIWAADTKVPNELGLKKNIGPIIDRGLKLAQGINEPYTPPKPAAPPPAAAPGGVVRCDRFDVSAAWEAGGSADAKRLRVSLMTDLPDTTVLMVSVDRSYWCAGDSTEYTNTYSEERTTVGQWRSPRTVELKHSTWQANLDKK